MVQGEKELEEKKKEIVEYTNLIKAIKRDHEFEQNETNKTLNLLKDSKT